MSENKKCFDCRSLDGLKQYLNVTDPKTFGVGKYLHTVSICPRCIPEHVCNFCERWDYDSDGCDMCPKNTCRQCISSYEKEFRVEWFDTLCVECNPEMKNLNQNQKKNLFAV